MVVKRSSTIGKVVTSMALSLLGIGAMQPDEEHRNKKVTKSDEQPLVPAAHLLTNVAFDIISIP